jgi:Protein of unknown function (DUF3500)
MKRLVLALMACCVIGYSQTRSREKQPPYVPSEPFTGITLGGKIEPGLFEIRSTGVSTAPVREAAQAFLDSLSQEQRQKTLFPVDDREWRMWDNRHFMARQGAGFDEMSEDQRRRAFDLLGAALSAKGLRKTRDIMRLNYTLAELANNFDEYGEWLYWITVMGKPHPSEPWGFQLDGHHVIVNYFVLGDQVVMTPTFMGSEPVRAEAGRYKGTVVMQDEQDKGLALMRSLDTTQQAKARVRSDKPGNFNLTEAYKDNVALESVGILATELTDAQRALLRALIREYVDNMDEGHARVRMAEVEGHLERTRFAWIGGTDEGSVFYYRIQSPVILIEFDHQSRVAPHRTQTPTREHIHTVVRTPNGNDYGKDLLRQHHARHPHAAERPGAQ